MFSPGEFPIDGPLDRQWRKVRCPSGTEPLRCVLIGRKMVKLFVHWDTLARRSVPCLAERCWYCAHHVERRPRGYLPAQNLVTGDWFVVEIPEGAGAAMERDIRFGGCYRGWEVTFRRHKEHRNAPVHYVLVRKLAPELVAPEWDVMPSIQRLYRDLVASGRLLANAQPPPKPEGDV